MDDLDRTQLEQILRLTKDNNRILRAIRRDAFIGGVVKLLVWIALIVVPLWFYLNYLAPVVNSALETMQQVQQVQGNASAQFSELNSTLENLKSLIPQYFQR